MAWSFRKRIKIAPGVNINLSKSGISTSIGPKGAKVTIGPKGTYLHTGIPGTGLYNRQKIDKATHADKTSSVSGLFDYSSFTSRSRLSSFEGYGVDMNMDHTGKVTFSFTDRHGNPITDDETKQKLIRKTKSLSYYKEKLDTLTKMTYDEVVADTAAFTDVYKKTPRLKTESEVNAALSRVTQKHYTPLVFEEEGPDKDMIQSVLRTVAKERIHYFFWWKNKPAREKYVEENTPIIYAQQLREWERKRDEFNAEQAEIKSRKETEYLQEYFEQKKPLEAFISRNEGEIIDALQAESKRIEGFVPGDFGLNFFFDYEYGVLYVELDLPEVEEIPKDKASYLPSGRISFKQKSMKEIQLDYVKCICGIAFFVTGRFFNVNSSIKYIQVSGYTQRINKVTGLRHNDYVYSVFFDKESFSHLNTEYIDPVEAMSAFPSRVKVSVTGILSTITPFAIPGSDKDRGIFPQKEGDDEPLYT